VLEGRCNRAQWLQNLDTIAPGTQQLQLRSLWWNWCPLQYWYWLEFLQQLGPRQAPSALMDFVDRFKRGVEPNREPISSMVARHPLMEGRPRCTSPPQGPWGRHYTKGERTSWCARACCRSLVWAIPHHVAVNELVGLPGFQATQWVVALRDGAWATPSIFLWHISAQQLCWLWTALAGLCNAKWFMIGVMHGRSRST